MYADDLKHVMINKKCFYLVSSPSYKLATSKKKHYIHNCPSVQQLLNGVEMMQQENNRTAIDEAN